MSNYANTKAVVAANVYTNNNNEVTATMVKTAINDVIDTLIAGGYIYAGVARPGDAATSPDANVFYIATEPGTYTNKDGLVVADGEVAVLMFDGSWSKVATGAATTAQIDEVKGDIFATTPGSKNILDIYTSPAFKTVINSSGVDTSNAQYNTSTYLPVEPSTLYTASQNGYVTYYDADKNRVGSRTELTSSIRSFTTHSQAAYIRFSCFRTVWGSAYINKGALEPSKDEFSPVVVYNKIDQNTADILALKNLLYKDVYTPVSGFTSGAYIQTVTYAGDVALVGSPTPQAGFSCIALPVEKGDRFRITGTGGTDGRLRAWLDQSYNILSVRSTNATDTDLIITAPADGYLVVNFITQYAHSLESVTVEPIISDDGGGDDGDDTDSPFYRGPFLAHAHRFSTRYRGLQESYPDRLTVGQYTTYAEAIALMDALVTAAGGYITKSALGTAEGTDGDGNPYTIYDYAFIPASAPNANVTGKRPVVMIDACLHGFEKTAFYGWYFFFKDLVENWEKNPSLAALRSGVEIHFIPIANPWGFDRDERPNANGVNLNRNFDVPYWQEVESGSDASGAAPFDQKEAAVIRDWLDAYPDAFLLIDTHTNGHYNASEWVEANHNMPVTGTDDGYYNRLFDVARMFIEDNTAVFAKDYNYVISPRFGQINPMAFTTTGGYINVYGAAIRQMIALTLEGFNGLIVNSEQVVHLYSPESKKINSEIFGNFLLGVLECYMP